LLHAAAVNRIATARAAAPILARRRIGRPYASVR